LLIAVPCAAAFAALPAALHCPQHSIAHSIVRRAGGGLLCGIVPARSASDQGAWAAGGRRNT